MGWNLIRIKSWLKETFFEIPEPTSISRVYRPTQPLKAPPPPPSKHYQVTIPISLSRCGISPGHYSENYFAEEKAKQVALDRLEKLDMAIGDKESEEFGWK